MPRVVRKGEEQSGATEETFFPVRDHKGAANATEKKRHFIHGEC